MGAQTTTFDLAGFRRALEERDSAAQVEMYAADATLTIADPVTTPGSPRVLRGQDEIRGWISDVSSREMTHKVGHCVEDEHGAALTEACRYSDGTNVLCATVLVLSDGLITDQRIVQVWDE